MIAVLALPVAVVALLIAEWRAFRTGVWLAKPAASTLFIIVALQAGALDSAFGQLIVLGLGLSWFGDVFLMGERDFAFVSGLAAFLLAHIAYAAAFLTQSPQVVPMLYVLGGMAVVATVVLRWLWPGLPKAMRLPVVSYIIVIAAMVTVAGGTLSARGPSLFVAAVVFAASDVFVARERFVTASLANRMWGLPLYYAAQLALAQSVGAG